MTLPTTTAQWTISASKGLDSLKLDKQAEIPSLGPTACLVKIAAVSLNYRDVAIPTGKYPSYFKDHLVPTSDGAGTVIAVGEKVKLHQVGDKVCTLVNQLHQSGLLSQEVRNTGTLGGHLDGPLREYAVFDETGLVPAPQSLSLIEAATLPCAAATAWNALFGITNRAVSPGDFVLTQGTGGVSLFAAQLAIAAGATVIGTTSSEKKATKLKEMGVHHVINYRTDPNWGETARRLSGGVGVNHVIEVGGEATLAQSLIATRMEGVVSMVGFLSGLDKPENPVSLMDCFKAGIILRSVYVGSKEMVGAMNKYIDEKGIKPIVDEKVFGFEQVRESYDYLLGQQFFGKVVIKVNDDSHP